MPENASESQFTNLFSQGMVRAGVATFPVVPGDPKANTDEIIGVCKKAAKENVAVLLLPELCLSSYAIDDLLLQDTLLNACIDGLQKLTDKSEAWDMLVLVGAPIKHKRGLYNCAIAIHKGQILGVVPKTYIPNYREFYEARYFRSASTLEPNATLDLCGQTVPMGSDLLFSAKNLPNFTLAMEICEDVWVPVPPSSHAALAGATLIANLSASNALIGKSEYRQKLIAVQSARCMAAYMYSAAGYGESTTDLAWDGQTAIFEAGEELASSERFIRDTTLTIADVDLERMVNERMRHNTFGESATPVKAFRVQEFDLSYAQGDLGLERHIERFPYVPSDDSKLNILCEEAFEIQTQGLVRRLEAALLDKIVIGVSGGLDSSHALLVAAQAMDTLGLPRTNILAYTLPAFATSKKTKSSAWALMNALGVSAQEINIEPAAKQMLIDLEHPAANDLAQYDVTYENVQAGARTSLLFRLANHHQALVLGTGDLSELALGWCTYGVGDHMSHYNVNASVSKTLIQHLIRWVASTQRYDEDAANALYAILETEISPELVPSNEGQDTPSQKTEEIVGPYALNDFFLYYISRHGMRPDKVAFLAWHAWRDIESGKWPANIQAENKVSYDLSTISFWLKKFLWRFFATSQFKRSAMPNGPKISSGGSLSPRGDWRAPSDGTPNAWLDDLSLNSD